jgi:excisionase family DNA binding protein
MFENLEERKPAGLDISETAEILGLKEPTIRAWIRDQKIDVVRLGRRVKVPVSEIRRLIEEGRRPRK